MAGDTPGMIPDSDSILTNDIGVRLDQKQHDEKFVMFSTHSDLNSNSYFKSSDGIKEKKRSKQQRNHYHTSEKTTLLNESVVRVGQDRRKRIVQKRTGLDGVVSSKFGSVTEKLQTTMDIGSRHIPDLISSGLLQPSEHMVQGGLVCGVNGSAPVDAGREGPILEDGMVEDVGSSDDDGSDDEDSMVAGNDLKQDAIHVTVEGEVEITTGRVKDVTVSSATMVADVTSDIGKASTTAMHAEAAHVKGKSGKCFIPTNLGFISDTSHMPIAYSMEKIPCALLLVLTLKNPMCLIIPIHSLLGPLVTHSLLHHLYACSPSLFCR
ncbi:hypothetical protein L1887_14795 [Cichorium endivia]|nr:hypothetical protein L1887_14795 [Cichorium endivia]